MPAPSKNTTLKLGGTPTAFSNEATTKVTANTVYQVTDAAKRILDYATNVVVEVDPDGVSGYSPADPADYVVDFMFGKVTFAADQGASALVRVSGAYIPPLDIAGAKACSVRDEGALADTSKFGDSWRTRMQTLQDVSGTVTSIEPLPVDHDPGAGTKRLLALMRAGTPMLLEYRPGGVGDYFRAWVLLESADAKSGGLDGLLEGEVAWKGTVPGSTNQTEGALSGWGT